MDAADGAVLVVGLLARTGQIAADDALDTEHAADQYGVAVCGVQQFLVLYEDV